MLKDLELRPDQLLDLLLDTVVVVDAHGRFLYVSPSVSGCTGAPPARWTTTS